MKRGVSGGERKRTNIGNQLLTDPALIILDEPTSGLDTSSALNLLLILKSMAKAGLTVISSIHQPSSQMFELFDKLILLVDGRPVYFGKSDEAINYFGKIGLKCEKFYNPADFMMGLILKEELSKKKGKSLKGKLIEDYKNHLSDDAISIRVKEDRKKLKKCVKKSREKEGKSASYAASGFTQYFTLLERAFFNATGDYLTILNFANIVSIAVIVSILWFQVPFTEEFIQDKIGVLFFSGVFASCFFPAFQALFTFPAEKPVIIRERKEGSYRLSIYFLAKMTAELPFELLFPILFNLIVYWFVAYRLNGYSIGMYFITVGVSATVSSSIGVMISSSINRPRTGVVITTVTLLFSMLSAGFYVNINKMPIWFSWLTYLSFMKYSYNGLLITQFYGYSIPQDLNFTSQYDSYNVTIPGTAIMNSLNVTFYEIGYNILILIGMSILFRIIGFIFLSRSIRKQI